MKKEEIEKQVEEIKQEEKVLEPTVGESKLDMPKPEEKKPQINTQIN